jgi:hypothetical protein
MLLQLLLQVHLRAQFDDGEDSTTWRSLTGEHICRESFIRPMRAAWWRQRILKAKYARDFRTESYHFTEKVSWGEVSARRPGRVFTAYIRQW